MKLALLCRKGQHILMHGGTFKQPQLLKKNSMALLCYIANIFSQFGSTVNQFESVIRLLPSMSYNFTKAKMLNDKHIEK